MLCYVYDRNLNQTKMDLIQQVLLKCQLQNIGYFLGLDVLIDLISISGFIPPGPQSWHAGMPPLSCNSMCK